ncbi:MAG: hypothetical protein ACI4MQ_01255 [Candidatus Coproplasma sp.]
MAKAHPFNFEGGEELSHMGATWFVSYGYYLYIDNNHKSWATVKTVQSRSSIYFRTTQYHEFWLNQILLMNDTKLNTNSLKIRANETKYMAKMLLDKFYRKR